MQSEHDMIIHSKQCKANEYQNKKIYQTQKIEFLLCNKDATNVR